MIIVDIEASGLSPDSYPIEIAWVDTRTDACDAFLINPETACCDWDYWNYDAEKIHG
ncbi:MAG: hypothetical protein V7739_20100 [Motiliproteus sp.]